MIGKVARYDLKKDHLNLIKALSLIRSKNVNFSCVLIGTNINQSNIKLVSKIKELNLSNHVKLLGQNDDITKVMNGLGLAILSTPKGVMSDVEARKNNVGGEIICRVF